MRKTLIVAALSCLITVPVFAKTYELPDANPAVTVTLPNAWKPSEVENGATAKGMEALIDEDIKFLTDQGVVIDKSTQQVHDTKQNGMDVSFLRWSGKDKDGPTSVTLGIYGVSGNLVLLVTAWSSPAGEKLYDKQLSDIVSSIKKR